ncbi:MAG: radical SAM protein [Candidatus Woesearchaeota archaeon]
MARLSFQDIKFISRKQGIEAIFLKYFSFFIDPEQIAGIGEYQVRDGSLDFPGLEETDARQRLLNNLAIGFKSLQNNLTGKQTIYVHRNSCIPLIGSLSFGIVDRNTTLIEVKPITGCNLNCIYCSVNEEAKTRDIVVEADYIVQELAKLVEYKESDGIEVHINSHGEPLFYEPLQDMVRKISQIKEVSRISIDTNATILTCDKANMLLEAGLTRFNISINSLSQGLADRIAGKRYPVKKVAETCRYLAKKGKLLLAPVMIPGINEGEIAKLVEFSKELKAPIGIQNYLNYRQGKNPVKQYPMKEFCKQMQQLEKKHKVKLLLTEADFNIRKTKPLKKPFKKGDSVEAVAVAPGRTSNESIAAKDSRSITVKGTVEARTRVRITRDKHNIFYGQVIK